MIGNLDMTARRHHEDDAPFQGRVVGHEPHRQGRMSGEDIAQDTGSRGVQLLSDDQRGGKISGQARDKGGERLDASG